MKWLWLLALLFGALLLALAQTLGERRDRRNYEFAPDMVRSAAYLAQSSNPFLPFGQTSQPPVAGTIPRGALPIRIADSARGEPYGRLLPSPFGDSLQPHPERGQKVYATFCQPCHGAGGRGDGPVVARGYPAPPPWTADRARLLSDGQIFWIASHGLRNMPGYGAQIDRRDRWEAVAHMRALAEAEP